MNNYAKPCFFVSILMMMMLSLLPLVAAAEEVDVVMGKKDPFDASRTVTSIPAVFSYVPEGNLNFIRDDSLTKAFGQNDHPAIAKVGTLTLAGWNTGDDVTFRRTNQSDRNNLKVFDPDNPANNFICNLYMGYGENGKANSPVAFNSVTRTYTDKNGKTGSFTAKMYSRANISSGTYYACIAGNANDNNPNLLSLVLGGR
jgi:hypothetical protein